jgi:ADP-dependent NAD(P)H-hydrate dehydratase / NAD(P)H-hydrate epimerase
MPSLHIPYTYNISTGAQCRKTDRLTIEKFGIDGFTLMETAGVQAAGFINKIEGHSRTGFYFCGKGNNGGDALVIARYLLIQYSHTCYLYFPAGTDDLSSDSQKNLDLLLKLQKQGLPVHLIEQDIQLDDVKPDYVIDGLLGTGLSSDLRAPFDSAVALINQSQARKYALDIPTGLHTDNGQLMPAAVRADYTLSFGALKPGFYLGQGPDYTGSIQPFNLSFPDKYRKSIAKLITPELDEYIPPIRRQAEHKYSDRLLYIVAGSEGLTGAAIMAAASAWKSGVGAVVLISPRGLLEIYEKNLPGIIKSPVGQRSDLQFQPSHSEEVHQVIQEKEGVLLIGPGMGRNTDTLSFIKKLLQQVDRKVVIDADALQVIPEISSPDKAEWILTPHPGEAGTLRGAGFSSQYDRISWAKEYSAENNVTLVSKGYPTFVGTPHGSNYITGYDTRIFARAGFGDVLAGSISGNLAITNNIELSIIRALLDGYIKAEHIMKESSKVIEPDHLI